MDPNWAGGVWAGGSCPNRLAVWNVTGMAAYWAVVRDPKGSISLRATNEGENNLYKKYSSIEGGNPPALHVWYSFSPVVPYAVTPAHGARVFTPSNPATAYYADGDGTPGKVLFAVYNYATQLVTAGWSPTVCSGCQGTWTIPALPDGWYQLYAIGHDGANYSPAWAGPQWFFIDTVPPAVPTNITPGPGSFVSSGTPITASARYSEPYGWAGQVLFYVLNSTGGVTTYAWSPVTASGALATVTLPALPIDTYTMWTYAYDGKLSWTSHTFSVAAKPGAPTGVQAQPGALSALLSWVAPLINGAPITRLDFTATDVDNGQAKLFSCAGACLTDNRVIFPNLLAGRNYRFTATATNAMGAGPASAPAPTSPALITVLDATALMPTSITAAPGDRSAIVSWEQPFNIPTATGWRVYVHSIDSSGQQVVRVVDAAASPTTIDGLQNGTSYSFGVQAIARLALGSLVIYNVESPESADRATAVPAGPPFAPSSVEATSANTALELSWEPPLPAADGTPGDNGSEVNGYISAVFKKGADPMGPALQEIPTDAATRSATFSNLINGQQYFATVRAINAKGPGATAQSDVQVPAGPPFAPTDLFATGERRQATLTWTPPGPHPPDGQTPGDNGSPITGYTVTLDPACPDCEGLIASGSANSTTVTGLRPATTYTFEVRASNSVGSGAASNSAQATTFTEPPDAPGTPQIEESRIVDGLGQVVISWNQPALNGSTLLGYEVQITPDCALQPAGRSPTLPQPLQRSRDLLRVPSTDSRYAHSAMQDRARCPARPPRSHPCRSSG